MKSAVTFLYQSSKETIRERDEKREWRKTYDPTYLPRRSMLASKLDNRRSRVMSIFNRPQSQRGSTFSNFSTLNSFRLPTRDSFASRSSVSDRDSMMRGPDRNSMAYVDRDSMPKEPENAYMHI